ncbi:MAG: AAA family ATPase [Peptococcaceae bacterium]|nr:AAA family ATPase [Peptococcaceae bacterium]
MEYRSEIRESQINTLLEKVENGNYGKYLASLKLVRIRGFANESVKFDFPVTAIVGPNGGGKTTVLGAAACAYKEIKPGRFFTKSGKFDNSMREWKNELIDKKKNNREFIKRSAQFKNLKWSREDLLTRNVSLFDVSRTISANERKELKQCASSTFKVEENKIKELEQQVSNAIGKILGKDISNYSQILVSDKGRITLLTGKTDQGVEYSEFHFGAGESSIIRMIISIESCQENSLVLIEEIENGLHPLATMRLVEYLIEVAERKKIQAIFTTHSNDALIPLPNKAIWASIGNKIVQGKLNIKSLRAITGQVSSQLAIFTEDSFSAMWIQTVLSSDEEIQYESIEVHGLEGDGTAAKINKYHNQNPSVKIPSLCYIDGDSEQHENEIDKVYRLPGEMPESYIYLRIKENIDVLSGELAVCLHKPYELQDKVKRVVNDTWITNRDRHLLFSQVGKSLGYISEEVVKSAFLSLWAQKNPNEVGTILVPIKKMIELTENK